MAAAAAAVAAMAAQRRRWWQQYITRCAPGRRRHRGRRGRSLCGLVALQPSPLQARRRRRQRQRRRGTSTADLAASCFFRVGRSSRRLGSFAGQNVGSRKVAFAGFRVSEGFSWVQAGRNGTWLPISHALQRISLYRDGALRAQACSPTLPARHPACRCRRHSRRLHCWSFRRCQPPPLPSHRRLHSSPLALRHVSCVFALLR